MRTNHTVSDDLFEEREIRNNTADCTSFTLTCSGGLIAEGNGIFSDSKYKCNHPILQQKIRCHGHRTPREIELSIFIATLTLLLRVNLSTIKPRWAYKLTHRYPFQTLQYLDQSFPIGYCSEQCFPGV